MKTIPVLLLATVLSYHCFAQLKDTAANNPGKQLPTVTVTSKTPLIRQESDRIIYDLQADPQSKVSSVLDMMRKVPYLSVDEDDNILLNGSRGYKVLINGRPSGLIETSLKEVLRSMPASTIKSIEVMINPPARYDAEGLAGIINIITIRQAYNGCKGSVNAYEKGPAGGPGAGGSFTYKQARLGISALAGISRYNAPETSSDLNRTGTGTNPSVLHQDATDQTRTHTAYAGIELSYEPDSLNLITGQLNWNSSTSTGSSAQTSALTEPNYQQHYRLDSDNGNEDGGLESTINYQHGFKANKDQMLTFSYEYLKGNSSLYNYTALSRKINYPVPDYHQSNSESLTGQTVQVDYVQSVKSLTIEGGLKAGFRENESGFRYRNLNPVTGEYETDPTRSNTFNYNQDVLAAYNSYAWQWSNWQFKAGARVEETIVRVSYSTGIMPSRQEYLNVLPAIVLSRKLKDNSSLSFSFSKRIQRPSMTELNPFVDRSDPGFESGGNPYLRPITSDAYQLSYLRSGKASLNIALGGLFFNHIFNAIPSYDPATNITRTRYENYGGGRVIKINIFLNYPITDKCSFALNADIRHVAVYGTIDNLSFNNSGFCVYIHTSGGYSFKKGWRANADITYRMGGISLPMGTTNGSAASSFSVSKDFNQSGLTASAAVSNPFTKYRDTRETVTGSNFLQTSGNQSYYRRFTVSLNYRFGKLKEDIKKNKRGISEDGNPGH